MHSTPFFPALRSFLAPPSSRLTGTLHSLRSHTLAKLEERFGPWVPARLFPKAADKQNSRDRIYTQRRTFWCFLWQILNPHTACREVVRQLQALLLLRGGPAISPEDGAYCRARGRLPADLLPQVLQATAQHAQRLAPEPGEGFLRNRPLKVLDGTSVTLPDTPENRQAYPMVQATYDGVGFPMMRLVVLFGLASGAVLAMLSGNLYTSEWRLFHLLLRQLAPADIALGDRGFGHFLILHLLQNVGVDFIGRSARKVDGRRRLGRLGPNDWLVQWRRPCKSSALLSAQQWAHVPLHRIVRIVRGSLWRPGYRVRQVTLVTTLLDPTLYPAEQILQAYARRWRLELCFDDLKTTLGMEMLSCKSPQMAQKEVSMHLIAHNLMRLIMAQAAQTYQVPLERISFKGTLDAVRQFGHAMCQARSQRKRTQLWDQLLRTLAADLVPERPNRREPRALKRQKNKYPRLNTARPKFRDHAKRHVRRSKARLRNASLK